MPQMPHAVFIEVRAVFDSLEGRLTDRTDGEEVGVTGRDEKVKGRGEREGRGGVETANEEERRRKERKRVRK